MPLRSYRLMAVTVLVLWVLAGPVGMTFNGCAMMGTMCEAACGIASYIIGPMVAPVTGPQAGSYLGPALLAPAAQIAAGPLTPPPKLARFSA